MFGLSKKEQNEEGQEVIDSNYIFYGSDKKFMKKIEFYSVLRTRPNLKFLTIVDCSVSIQYASIKITENFESLPEFKDLKGLKAINLSKKNEYLGNLETLSPDDSVIDSITTGDFIYFDLISEEIWLKANITMGILNHSTKFVFSFEMKVKTALKFSELKYYLIAMGLKEQTKNSSDYLAFVVYQVLFPVADFNTNYSDEATVSELFTFNSEINCQITFISLEELLFEKLKSLKDQIKTNYQERWDEFSYTTFYLFRRSEKFKPEYNFIVTFIRNLITKNKGTLLNEWYFYVPKEEMLLTESYISSSEPNEDNIISETDSSLTKNIESNSERIIVVLPSNDPYIVSLYSKNNQKPFLSQYLPFETKISYLKERKTSYGQEQKIELNFSNDENTMRSKLNSIMIDDEQENNGSKYSPYFTSESKVKKDNLEASEDLIGPLFPRKSKNFSMQQQIHSKAFSQAGKFITPHKRRSKNKLKFLIKQFRKTSNYLNLVKDFQSLIQASYFVKNVKSLFKSKIPDGYLENLEFPEIRNYKPFINEKSNKFFEDIYEEDDEDFLGNKVGSMILRILLFVFLSLCNFAVVTYLIYYYLD